LELERLNATEWFNGEKNFNSWDNSYFSRGRAIFEVLVSRAVSSIKAGQATAALEEVENSFGVHLTHPRLYVKDGESLWRTVVPFTMRLIVARLLVLTNRRNEAKKYLFDVQTACRRMIKSPRVEPQVWRERLRVVTLLLACEVATSGDLVTALIILKELGNDTTAKQMKARIHLKLGDPAAALACLPKEEESGSNVQWYAGLAAICEGKFEEATNAFDSLLTNPNDLRDTDVFVATNDKAISLICAGHVTSGFELIRETVLRAGAEKINHVCAANALMLLELEDPSKHTDLRRILSNKTDP